MSRRREKRKQNIVNVFRTIAGLALVCICVFVFSKYIISASIVVDGASVTKADSKNKDVLIVQQILIDIENGDGQSAVKKINEIGSDFSDSAVLEYLNNFRDYYIKNSGENKKQNCMEAVYFVQRSGDLKDFFEKNHVANVIQFLEIIPYFSIKYFEQGKKNNLKKNNAVNLNLYEKYIKTFIEAGSTTITSSEADIICLYISAKKLSSGNSDTEVGLVQKEIEKNQNEYRNQLGENGSCVRQRDALERMHTWCINKINAHGPKDWLVGQFPSYTIPIEKK